MTRTDLLFYGTSQPGVWALKCAVTKVAYEKTRASVITSGALRFRRRPDTGEANRAYQFTPHDGWDLIPSARAFQ